MLEKITMKTKRRRGKQTRERKKRACPMIAPSECAKTLMSSRVQRPESHVTLLVKVKVTRRKGRKERKREVAKEKKLKE